MFQDAIRRALAAPCNSDLLRVHQGRSYGSRVCFQRIGELYALCQAGELPTTKVLARKFSTSRKTIQRDLRFLCRTYGVRIVWDAVKAKYFTRPIGQAADLEAVDKRHREFQFKFTQGKDKA